ncbi:MAG: hypothetical protein HRT88_08790 [Lentisphaeraceae bacterium]|nr:hypothetical protein [Lentisphaeraceae bacterium]
MKKAHFTMIEMVVVIATMALLSSITFTLITSSKDLSMKTVCMSNLHQIQVVTELHRKDNGQLPYEENWFVDFTYAASYLEEGTELAVFTCPSDPEYSEPVRAYGQLNGLTSYVYIPSKAMLELNLEDGLAGGFTQSDFDDLPEFTIADNSLDHHNGKLNILGLIEEYFPPIIAGPSFTASGGTITIDSPVTISYESIGAAISWGSSYDMAVTTTFNFDFTDSEGVQSSESLDPFGDYTNPIDGNLNSDMTDGKKSHDLEKVYDPGTEISVVAKSWQKTSTSNSGNDASDWKEYLEIDSGTVDGTESDLANVVILTNGQDVPKIEGYLDQGDVEAFLEEYVDADGKVKIGDDQAIILFELGTTDMSKSTADFQDLALLLTFVPEE